jgi:hypothetical protein
LLLIYEYHVETFPATRPECLSMPYRDEYGSLESCRDYRSRQAASEVEESE